MLGNPGLIQADATTLLAPEGADAMFGNFLGLLFENRRLPLLPEIAGLYDELRFEAERVVKAKVTSAVALPAELYKGPKGEDLEGRGLAPDMPLAAAGFETTRYRKD